MTLEKKAAPPLKLQQPVLYIEHCRSCSGYRDGAIKLHAALSAELKRLQPQLELQLLLNSDGLPRRGAFEVAIATAPTTDIMSRQLLWSGITKQSRALKVPHVDDIIAPACHALKLKRAAGGVWRFVTAAESTATGNSRVGTSSASGKRNDIRGGRIGNWTKSWK